MQLLTGMSISVITEPVLTDLLLNSQLHKSLGQ